MKLVTNKFSNPVEVVILHVYKTWNWLLINLATRWQWLVYMYKKYEIGYYWI